jgi:hypothetical protein
LVGPVSSTTTNELTLTEPEEAVNIIEQVNAKSPELISKEAGKKLIVIYLNTVSNQSSPPTPAIQK